MAVIKFTNSKGALKKILVYVKQEYKTLPHLISSKDCMPQSALAEMDMVKRQFGKLGGRLHLVQSFHPKYDRCDPDEVHQLGRRLAERFKGFYVLPPKKGVGYVSQGEYQAARKGARWKDKLKDAIDEAMSSGVATKAEFISYMVAHGYKVRWEPHHKTVTYTTPEGYKCRDSKLNDEKYSKASMEAEFVYRTTRVMKWEMDRQMPIDEERHEPVLPDPEDVLQMALGITWLFQTYESGQTLTKARRFGEKNRKKIKTVEEEEKERRRSILR